MYGLRSPAGEPRVPAALAGDAAAAWPRRHHGAGLFEGTSAAAGREAPHAGGESI